jgi:hypothetical protein
VPYLHGLRLLAEADFTIILGSDDPDYTPSKAAACLSTGRPFVAVLHESSPAVPLLRRSSGGVVVTFGADIHAIAAELAGQLGPLYERAGAGVSVQSLLPEALDARELARLQCVAFEAAVRHASPQGIPCVE